MRKQVEAFEEWALEPGKEESSPCKLISIGKDPSSNFTDARGTAEIKKGDEVFKISWSAKRIEDFWHTSLDKQETLTDFITISDIEQQISDNID